MPNFRLLLEYDGAPFEGWQVQARDARTVQGCLEAALEKITGRSVVVTGSGRTDAGVHAEGQVASFGVETDLAPERLRLALNGVLPREIAVRELRVAPPGFDARRAARRKLYCYRIWNGRERSPLRAARFHHVPQPLDADAMREAAGRLEGEHDFACFRAAGSDVKTNVRTLHRVTLEGKAGGELALAVEGSGFLRYMVRNIAGTLLEVGLGKRAPESLDELLASRDRGQAGPTAPAHGLTLVRVEYEEDDPSC
jgi:tRNA pseudouridine38-40 synthase